MLTSATFLSLASTVYTRLTFPTTSTAIPLPPSPDSALMESHTPTQAPLNLLTHFPVWHLSSPAARQPLSAFGMTFPTIAFFLRPRKPHRFPSPVARIYAQALSAQQWPMTNRLISI